ncbi:DUF5640 domain-containing protein [Ruminococcus sp.]|uniref:DUF5640 domain-containing protein n=1 Tax=Ruminococcus sp. TaxID=41978 RepID=UPI003867D012
MEENKDFFAETENTQASAEINNEAAETPVEVKGTINVIPGEDGPTAVFTPDNTPTKKKTIQTPIIIAGVIVIAFIAAFFIFSGFFNSSIVGTWVLVEDSNGATYDEAGDGVTYYTLDKDGNITVSVGTITQKSTYTTSEENGTKYVNSSNVFSGSYTISGNIFTGRTFKLTVEGVENPYIFKSATVKKPTLKVPDGFKPSDKLTGSWNIPSYDITYTFNDDGTFIANMYDTITYEGVYTYDDTNISVTYFADSETKIDIPYAFDGDNTLVMNGMGYYRMNDDGSLVATPDQV